MRSFVGLRNCCKFPCDLRKNKRAGVVWKKGYSAVTSAGQPRDIGRLISKIFFLPAGGELEACLQIGSAEQAEILLKTVAETMPTLVGLLASWPRYTDIRPFRIWYDRRVLDPISQRLKKTIEDYRRNRLETSLYRLMAREQRARRVKYE